MAARKSVSPAKPRIILPVGGTLAPVQPSRASLARQARLTAALADIRSGLTSEPDRFLPHQRRAIHRIVAHYATPRVHPNAIVIMPPAAGKTKLFCAILEAHARLKGEGARPAIVLAPTKDLVLHTLDALSALGVDTARGWPSRVRRDVHVMSYNAFQSAVGSGRMGPDDIDLIVLNDAHVGLSEKRQDILDRFNYACPILGFSATPTYHLGKTLFRVLGFDNKVVDLGDVELRDERAIAPVVNYILHLKITGTLPRDPERVEVILKNASRAAMLAFYQRHEDPELGLVLREKPFIGFHDRCEDAELATDSFNAARRAGALPCQTLTGLHDPDARRTAIESLRKGEVQGLNNAKIFVEGPNFESVGAVLNFVPTSSLVRQIQRCGRALSINPAYDRDDPRQLSAVVDLCIEIEGVIQGRPRFYFEAVEDISLARIVEMEALHWTAFVDPGDDAAATPNEPGKGRQKKGGDPASPAGTGKAPTPTYSVSSGLKAVRHLLKNRDRYATWMTRDEILAGMPQASPHRAAKLFTSVETALAASLPGKPHDVPFESALLHAGRALRGDVDEPVYSRESVKLLALLLDQPDSAPLKDAVALDDLVGPHAGPVARTRAKRIARDYLLCRRRGEGGIRQTAEAGAIPILILRYAMTPKGPRVMVPSHEIVRVSQLLTLR